MNLHCLKEGHQFTKAQYRDWEYVNNAFKYYGIYSACDHCGEEVDAKGMDLPIEKPEKPPKIQAAAKRGPLIVATEDNEPPSESYIDICYRRAKELLEAMKITSN